MVIADLALKSTWSTAFINSLPDSSFAVILPGGEKDESGRTTPRSLRKLPHHGTSGAVDLPHLRAALSREPQTDMPEDAHRRARVHLQRHARALGIGGEEDALPIETLLDSASLEGDEALRSLKGLWERRRSEGREPSDRLVALVEAYRQQRQVELDALLALLTTPSQKATDPPEPLAPSAGTDPPEGATESAARAGLVAAHLRRARLKALRRKYQDLTLPPDDPVSHLTRLAVHDPFAAAS